MNLETVFSLSTFVAAAGWLALIVAPRRAWAIRLASFAIPSILGLLYVTLIVTHWRGSAGGFSSLHDVALLFGRRELLLAGWVHYLAFDLVVGAWLARDAAISNVGHGWLVPCLLLTFLFGPAGLLTYFLVRAWKSPARAAGA